MPACCDLKTPSSKLFEQWKMLSGDAELVQRRPLVLHQTRLHPWNTQLDRTLLIAVASIDLSRWVPDTAINGLELQTNGGVTDGSHVSKLANKPSNDDVDSDLHRRVTTIVYPKSMKPAGVFSIGESVPSTYVTIPSGS